MGASLLVLRLIRQHYAAATTRSAPDSCPLESRYPSSSPSHTVSLNCRAWACRFLQLVQSHMTHHPQAQTVSQHLQQFLSVDRDSCHRSFESTLRTRQSLVVHLSSCQLAEPSKPRSNRTKRLKWSRLRPGCHFGNTTSRRECGLAC